MLFPFLSVFLGHWRTRTDIGGLGRTLADSDGHWRTRTDIGGLGWTLVDISGHWWTLADKHFED